MEACRRAHPMLGKTLGGLGGGFVVAAPRNEEAP